MNSEYNFYEPENYIEFSSQNKTMKKLVNTILNILAIAGAN